MQPPPRPTGVTINLASMVDVTMCLMIFFMLTTHMVKNENSTIDLPNALSAKDVEKKDLGERFVVNIRSLERADGIAATYVVQEKPMTLVDLEERLRSERLRTSDVNCVIRADRDLPYKYVQAVMLVCAKVGVQKVTFSAVPRGDRP